MKFIAQHTELFSVFNPFNKGRSGQPAMECVGKILNSSGAFDSPGIQTNDLNLTTWPLWEAVCILSALGAWCQPKLVLELWVPQWAPEGGASVCVYEPCRRSPSSSFHRPSLWLGRPCSCPCSGVCLWSSGPNHPPLALRKKESLRERFPWWILQPDPSGHWPWTVDSLFLSPYVVFLS